MSRFQTEELSTGSFTWRAPGVPSITISRRAMEGIQQEITATFAAVPRRGAETGGILLGHRNADEIFVEDFEPIPIEHRYGPSYKLSDADHQLLRETLDWFQTGNQPVRVLGVYRSITKTDFALGPEDEELIRTYFSAPDDVVLLVKPSRIQGSVADFFLWRGGRLEEALKPIHFPFTSVSEMEDAAAALQVNGGEESPRAADALPVMSNPTSVAAPNTYALQPETGVEQPAEGQVDEEPEPARYDTAPPEAAPLAYQAVEQQHPEHFEEPENGTPQFVQSTEPVEPPVAEVPILPEPRRRRYAYDDQLPNEDRPRRVWYDEPERVRYDTAAPDAPPPAYQEMEQQRPEHFEEPENGTPAYVQSTEPVEPPAAEVPVLPEPRRRRYAYDDLLQPESRPRRTWFWPVLATVLAFAGGALGYLSFQSDRDTPAKTESAHAATRDEARPDTRPLAPVSTPASEPAPKAAAKPSPLGDAPSNTADRLTDQPTGDTGSQIRAVLSRWSAALRSGDIDAAAECYAPRVGPYFTKREVSRDFIRQSISDSISRYGKPEVYKISDISIKPSKTGSAIVTFRKEWKSSSGKFSGAEIEKLFFVRNGSEWQIASEKEQKVFWVKRAR